MLRTARFRSLIVALLIAAQPVSVVYASGALALGAPCPVHAALVAPQADHSAMHHQHGAAHETPTSADLDRSPSSDSSFNCCAGHLVGVCAPVASLAAMGWVFVKTEAVQLVPATADLAVSDPPPRIFL
jgi:hypothetical protein